ncbi:MAG: DNA polymerase III subunit alpha [Elusimicrobiota bacterium]
MPKTEFVHLHNHTEYSLLDGACRLVDDHGNPAELLKFISSYGMSALSITDHGNLFGAIEFYNACRTAGIKPIIGCEFYMAPVSRFNKEQNQGRNLHITLLARDYTGYKNLIKLTSSAYLEGFYYRPRIDKDLLRQICRGDSSGLICLSGCLQGELPGKIISNGNESAVKIIDEYKQMFGPENYYVEIMDNGMPEQQALLPKLIEVAKNTNTKVVATNDCHYLKQEDAYAHDVLLCIGTGTTLDAPKRLKFSTNQFYYKTPQEMENLFSYVPDSIKNTLEVAEKCNLEIKFDQLLLPHYQVPQNQTPDSFLRQLCEKGIKERYPKVTNEIKERLDYELSVIEEMGFSPYFLIVWDFVQYARKNKIRVGPGRGSGAGSIVAYSLGITNIDPLKYGLLFERFLNPSRRTMPDLDIDFADYGRDQVISYVRNKYGQKNVAQIITFGTMQARLVVRDVARVLGWKLEEADKIAKLIPKMDSTIWQALNSIKELKELYKDPAVKKLLDTARHLEGLKRHQGVHAAGLVIAKDELTEYVPLSKSTRKIQGEVEVITTQYVDDALVKLGLLKIDFLGLRTLTVIEETMRLINATSGGKQEFDIIKVPIDDKKTFKLLQEGRTNGVFQVESSGMKDLLKKLKPTVFEDLIALVSLYRPGPMGSGMLEDFTQRKHGEKKIEYEHNLLEEVLKETYGVIVYQEQVMQISTRLANFSAGQADDLRKAMSKKNPDEMQKFRETFYEGAKKNGIDKRTAEKIYNQMETFGGYGFNKSHATAYALLAYRTAYLKANYPIEYACSLLTSEIGRGPINKEEGSKFINYMQEAKTLGINILPPDIQKSDAKFTIEKGAIRFALLAIKNVGEQAVKDIIEKRKTGGPFKSFNDFYKRVDSRQVNKKVIESLIKAGAFDFIGLKDEIALPTYTRAKAMVTLEKSSALREKESSAQESLFEMPEVEKEIKYEPLPEHILLNYEREVLGFYISGHPLAKYKKTIETITTHPLNKLPSDSETSVIIAGMIVNVKSFIRSKTKEQMAKFKLENFDGEIDVLVFPRVYSETSKIIKSNEMVVIRGRVNSKDDNKAIFADEIITLEKYENYLLGHAQKVLLKFSSVGADDLFINRLKHVLEKNPGSTKVLFKILSHSKQDVFVETGLKVELTEKLFGDLKGILGENSWEIM